MTMSTDAASVLYGGTDAGPEMNGDIVSPPATESAARTSADVLYGEKPPYAGDKDAPAEVQAARAADSARKLFDPQLTYKGALPDGAVDGLDHAAAREVFADLSATGDEVTAYVALARTTPTADDATRNAWLDQSAAWLDSNEISDADLQSAQRLMERDPRVMGALRRSGHIVHPKVIQFFVSKARQMRLRG